MSFFFVAHLKELFADFCSLYLAVWIEPNYWFLFYQWQVRDFEDNGLNLTAIKREEVERLKYEIDELSLRYIQNLNEDSSCLFFTEDELAGLPLEFLQVFILNFIC